MSAPRVVVVGAGLSGLAAASALERAGVSTTVIEAEPQAGGRLRSAPADGPGPDCLPATAPSHTPALDRLAKETGAAGAIRWIPLEDVELVVRGRRRAMCLARAGRSGSVPGLSPRDALRARRLRRLLERFAPRLDPDTPECVGSLDDRSVEELCALYVGRRILDRVFGPLLEGHFGLDPSETSRAALLLLLGPEGGPSLKLGFGIPTWVGSLATGLDDLRLGLRAARVHSEGRVVELDTGESIPCDAVCLAVPGPEAGRLLPSLPPFEESFLESCRYAPLRLGMRAEKGRASAARITWVARSEKGPLAVRFWLPPAPGQETGRALLVLRAGPEASALARGLASAIGEEGSASPLREVHVPRFAARFPVGRYGALARFREEWRRSLPVRRTALCGDYLAGPHLEAAASSGLRAARELLELLDGRRAGR